jgi:3-oxoadipate enol-lactonase
MMSEQRVEIGGLSFNCRLDGSAGAPWLVFSNSLMTDLSMWDEQAAALAGRYRILRYDQRGHGGTGVPDHPCTFEELAADAAALLDWFKVERATFIGISMGAATGFFLAARHPGRVARLVACDGPAKTAPGNEAAWNERIALAQAGGMAALAGPTVGRWFTPASVAAGLPVLAKVRAMIENTPVDGFIACARALQSYDIAAALPGLSMPVLLMAGEKDGALPVMMRETAAQIPQGRFTEIPAAGHLINLEQPASFMAALEPFLAVKPGA